MLWQYCCDVRFRGIVPDISAFLRLLHSEVAKWLEMPEMSLAHHAVHLYMEGFQGWLFDRNIPMRDGSAVDMQKCLGGGEQRSLKMRPLRWEKAGQKWARAAAAEPRETAPGVRVPDIYIDGSFAPEALRVGFAGFDV